MKRQIFAYPLLILLIGICISCGASYNTNFPPPPQNAKPSDVFPTEIFGKKGSFKKSPTIGIEGTYGDNKMFIHVGRAQNASQANAIFKNTIVPKFKDMPNRFSGQINGKWQARGTDKEGRLWYGWINDTYIFVINGANKKYLEEVIKAFPYISK